MNFVEGKCFIVMGDERWFFEQSNNMPRFLSPDGKYLVRAEAIVKARVKVYALQIYKLEVCNDKSFILNGYPHYPTETFADILICGDYLVRFEDCYVRSDVLDKNVEQFFKHKEEYIPIKHTHHGDFIQSTLRINAQFLLDCGACLYNKTSPTKTLSIPREGKEVWLGGTRKLLPCAVGDLFEPGVYQIEGVQEWQY